MRLIGGHDYYDGGSQGAVDTSIVFARKSVDLDILPAGFPDCVILFKAPGMRIRDARTGRRFERTDNPIRLQPFWFFIGGDTVPAVLINWNRVARSLPSADFMPDTHKGECVERVRLLPADRTMQIATICFSTDEVMAAPFIDAQDDKGRDMFRQGRPFGAVSGNRKLRSCLDGIFSINRDVALDFCIENRVITGYATRNRQQKWMVANGPHLGYFHLYRKINPSDAHMRIARFIGGVLPSRESMVELNDADRLRKAGMDATSFRGRSAKKPRRKKPERKGAP